MSGEPLPSRPAFPLDRFPQRPASAARSRCRSTCRHGCSTNSSTARVCSSTSGSTASSLTAATRLRARCGTRRSARRPNALPRADQAGDERIHSRSVSLSSDRHGLTAVIDLVEGEGGRVTPVDYKHGAPREQDGTLEAWPTDRVQVVRPGADPSRSRLCVRRGGRLLQQDKQRVRVAITEELVTATLAAVDEARRVAAGGLIPPPLVDSPKCPRCSLVGICLPDETRALLYGVRVEPDGAEQLSLFDAPVSSEAPTGASSESVRRLVPAGDDLRPLYVTGYGFSVGKSGGVLQIKEKGSLIQEARLNDVSQVNLFGSISVTAGAVQALCELEASDCLLLDGRLVLRDDDRARPEERLPAPRAVPPGRRRVLLPAVARAIVATKIRNQRTMLQRNHVEPPSRALEALKRLAEARARCSGSGVAARDRRHRGALLFRALWRHGESG